MGGVSKCIPFHDRPEDVGGNIADYFKIIIVRLEKLDAVCFKCFFFIVLCSSQSLGVA